MSFTHTRKLLVLFNSFFSVLMFANMGPQGFYAFKKRVFIETGTFGGDSIQKALDAGFEEIYSIDIGVSSEFGL